jgi:hypothetical protein
MGAGDAVLGETSAAMITYMPGSGASRQIEAQIHYLGPQPMDGLAGGSRPQFDLLVRNDSVAGISSRELDTAVDKAEIPPRIGMAAQTVRLVKIMAQDRAMLRLRAW